MYTAKMPHCSFHASYTPIKVPCCTMLYHVVPSSRPTYLWKSMGLPGKWSANYLMFHICVSLLGVFTFFDIGLSENSTVNHPTLWFSNISMEITMFNGKIHYKWPFSIAMLVYQRVNEWLRHHSPCERPRRVPRTERYDLCNSLQRSWLWPRHVVGMSWHMLWLPSGKLT